MKRCSCGGATLLLLLGCGLLVAPVAQAQDANPFLSLFAYEAEVSTSAGGLQRLDLPAEVLRACRGDLADVRLFDADGRELPYFAVRGMPSASGQAPKPVLAEVVQVQRQQFGTPEAPLLREIYELSAPVSAAAQSLSVAAKGKFSRDFEARFIPTSDGSASERVLARGSVFRLPPAGERLRVALGVLPGPGRVRLTLTGQASSWLEPRFSWQSEPLEEKQELNVPLRVLSQQQRDKTSVLELERPVGIVPSALVFETDTPLFDRDVEVRDAGPNHSDAVVGHGHIVRLDDSSVPRRALSIAEVYGDRLLIEIHNLDSRPLDALTVSARIAQPTLLFVTQTATHASLRYGAGWVHSPRYDVAALLGAAKPAGTRADGLPGARRATLAAAHPNPTFRSDPALLARTRPGAVVDTRGYEQRRMLEVPASPQGLTRIQLVPADLASARPDLGDVRIIDATHRQRAYLVEADAKLERLIASVTQLPHTGSATHYPIALEPAPLPLIGIELASDQRYIDRAYELYGSSAQGQRSLLASGRFARRDDSPLAIEFVRTQLAALELVVEDGSDAPIEWNGGIRARVPLPALYLVAEPGTYTLLLGQPETAAPRYEIEQARALVLALESGNVVPAALELNPARAASARVLGLMRAGAPLDRQPFSHRRELKVPAARDGLTRFQLEAEDLARARPDLADLRIIDAQSRQRPYLLEPAFFPARVPLRMQAPLRSGTRTRYRFDLSAKPLAIDALELDSELGYFDRHYELRAIDASGAPRPLASGQLSRHGGDVRRALVIAVPRSRVWALELEIDGGEDAPLAFRSAEIVVALPRVSIVAEAGNYGVLLGQPTATAPAYDIEQAREVLLALDAGYAELGPLVPNSAYRARARLGTDSVQTALMWSALVLALLALTWLTFRMLRPAA